MNDPITKPQILDAPVPENHIIDSIKVWFENSLTFHQRLMANYLRKRDWVVFYLEPQNRECVKDFCWLKLDERERNVSNN